MTFRARGFRQYELSFLERLNAHGSIGAELPPEDADLPGRLRAHAGLRDEADDAIARFAIEPEVTKRGDS